MTALSPTINTTINDSSTDLLFKTFKTKELHISTAVEL
jgi:hypothetical protein